MISIDLAGQRILVTGSTRGIGWAIAQRLADAGATVLLHGRQQEAVSARVAELRAAYPATPDGVVADVADAASLRALFQRVFKEHKGLDGLINNAGVMEDGVIGMISDESIRSQFAVNAEATVHTIQLAARLMLRGNGGVIVNLSSIMGRLGNANQLVYSAAKAASIGATLAAAKELGPKNIRVNCVAPGMINTEMIAKVSTSRREELIGRTSLRRIGTTTEVADVVVWLCSPFARFVTGQIIGVDGGMSV